MNARHLVVCFLAVMLLLPGTMEAQTSDLEQCAAAAAEKSKDRMEAAASRLEAEAASMKATRPVEALIIRARVRTQCRIPFAPQMQRGALLAESNELLAQALAQNPQHLAARFTLGMNHYNAPKFLGRTGMGVLEFERVLRDHGQRTDPVIASAYFYLGELYQRQGREELAVQTWKRGAGHFPADARLREKAKGTD